MVFRGKGRRSECIPKIKPLRFGDRLNITFERNEVTNDWLMQPE